VKGAPCSFHIQSPPQVKSSLGGWWSSFAVPFPNVSCVSLPPSRRSPFCWKVKCYDKTSRVPRFVVEVCPPLPAFSPPQIEVFPAEKKIGSVPKIKGRPRCHDSQNSPAHKEYCAGWRSVFSPEVKVNLTVSSRRAGVFR